MKASLLSFRFVYNSYNSLISQILQLANDNPSFYSSIRILKVLFTDRKCFALIAAYLNHWISGKNQKQLFQCLYSFPHLMPLKDWSSKLRRIYALLCAAKQLALSSLRIDATKCHFKDCLACYGSSMQQNARIGSTVLINLSPREKKHNNFWVELGRAGHADLCAGWAQHRAYRLQRIRTWSMKVTAWTWTGRGLVFGLGFVSLCSQPGSSACIIPGHVQDSKSEIFPENLLRLEWLHPSH